MHYAAGTLPPYESMLMAAYLAVSIEAQRKLAAFEAEAGRMMEEVEPVQVTHACLNNILAVIEPAGAAAAPHPASAAARAADADCTLPLFMQKLLNAHCPQQSTTWEEIAPGVGRIDIRLCRSEPRQRHLRLMRFAPGTDAPAHRHQGLELTLVLDGTYYDGRQNYRRGDLVIMADHSDHNPHAGDAGCVCLILSDAPVRFHNPVLRLLNHFWRF
jgi:putative transcriptional regulator